jgi:hypothetical protein
VTTSISADAALGCFSLPGWDAVNQNKQLEERVLRVLDELRDSGTDIDQRWLAIGRTHLETAFMCINRAIFRPGRVELPEDRQ